MGGEIFCTCPDRPTQPPVKTGSFPGVKSARGVTLTPHPLLVPWSRKGRAIPLLPLWAVRPVQSLSACKRVHFMGICQTFKFGQNHAKILYNLCESLSMYCCCQHYKSATEAFCAPPIISILLTVTRNPLYCFTITSVVMWTCHSVMLCMYCPLFL